MNATRTFLLLPLFFAPTAHAEEDETCKMVTVTCAPAAENGRAGQGFRRFTVRISGSTFVAHGKLEQAIREKCGDWEVQSVEADECRPTPSAR